MTLQCREIGYRADEYTLRLEQYSDIEIPISIKDANGVAVDCTGASLSWQIRRSASDPTPLKSFTIVWTNRASGLAKATLLNIDLACGSRETDAASRYFHDCVFTDSLGNDRPVVKGPCIVNRGGVR